MPRHGSFSVLVLHRSRCPPEGWGYRPELTYPPFGRDTVLKETTGGEFRVYRASIRLL